MLPVAQDAQGPVQELLVDQGVQVNVAEELVVAVAPTHVPVLALVMPVPQAAPALAQVHAKVNAIRHVPLRARMIVWGLAREDAITSVLDATDVKMNAREDAVLSALDATVHVKEVALAVRESAKGPVILAV